MCSPCPEWRPVPSCAATPLNLALLAEQGFDLSPAGAASPDDVVLALRAVDDEALGRALAAVEELLAPPRRRGPRRRRAPRVLPRRGPRADPS